MPSELRDRDRGNQRDCRQAVLDDPRRRPRSRGSRSAGDGCASPAGSRGWSRRGCGGIGGGVISGLSKRATTGVRAPAETRVWTAPIMQEVSEGIRRSVRLRSCFRPVGAAHRRWPRWVSRPVPKRHGGLNWPCGLAGYAGRRIDRSPSSFIALLHRHRRAGQAIAPTSGLAR